MNLKNIYIIRAIDLGPNSICLGVQVQETLRSAAEVILSSAISIVSGSSNMDFRNACLDSMKVSHFLFFVHVFIFILK